MSSTGMKIIRTMTSFGNELGEDQMIVDKAKEGEENAELEREIKKVSLPKIGTAF